MAHMGLKDKNNLEPKVLIINFRIVLCLLSVPISVLLL